MDRTALPLRALFALLTVLLVSCQRPPARVDAEGFGGGGSLDRAQRRIIGQLEFYQAQGVPGSFCHAWANCEKTTSQKQCDRLEPLSEDKSKTLECRNFFQRNLPQLLAVARNTPLKVVPNPLTIVAPDGSVRSLDAIVPKGLQEIWIRESLLTDKSVSDEDLTGLLVHEYNHLLPSGAGGNQIGDFETVGQFTAKDLFDTLGASVALESASDNTYRREILKDTPALYLPLDDKLGTTKLWDVSGSNRDSSISGDINYAITSANRLGTAISAFASSAVILDPFTSDGPLSQPVTVEFWLNTQTYARSFGIVVGFDRAALALQNNILGFSYGDGHVIGTDVTNYAGKWIHIVAKFDPTGITGSRLYINGALRELDHTLGAPAVAPTLSRQLALNGRPSDATYRIFGSFDEVAVYTHDLSPQRVAAHYTASGSTLETQTNGPGVIGDIEGVRTTSAWDEFKCWDDDCTYEIGKSSMANLRQWIGHSTNPAYPQGTTKVQRFLFRNLEVNKKYRLNGIVAQANDSTAYTVRAGTGEVQFLTNTTRNFTVGYYPGSWNMDFIAKKSTVTLTLSNGLTSGSSYLSFDAFIFSSLE